MCLTSRALVTPATIAPPHVADNLTNLRMERRHISRARRTGNGLHRTWSLYQVNASSSLVANDPYEPRLIVENVGYLPVYNLLFRCDVTMPILSGKPGPLNFTLELRNRASLEAGDNLSPESIFAPQDSVTKTCATRISGLAPKDMDFAGTLIDFFVTYRPFVSFAPT
jgi:hypothetical protein